MDEQSSSWKRSCLVRLLFSRFTWMVVALAIAVFWCARVIDPFLNKHAKNIALAAEVTDYQMSRGPRYSGGSVVVTQELLAVANKENADIDVIRELIAAAVSKGVAPHHLLGLAKVESSYCKNIGGGIAYVEAQKRYNSATGPNSKKWWFEQLTALKRIAADLGVDVKSIPGSVGAGAISCLQVMPSNWVELERGDYRQYFDAGLNGAAYLVRAGYAKDPVVAIHSYNSNAGQPYVDSVLTAAAIWEAATANIVLYEGIEVPWWVAFLENLAWYMEGNKGLPPWVKPGPPGGPPPIIEGIAIPYPGSFICGNWFGRVIGTYIHYGQDFCLPGTVNGPAFAAIDCRVTVAKLVPKSDWEAITWSASGYVVVCEGVTEDGHKIETIYGHLNNNTLPSVGDQFEAGGYLADTQCLGNPAIELCSITAGKPDHHLHFGVKIDGQWVNPNDFLKRSLVALMNIIRSVLQ